MTIKYNSFFATLFLSILILTISAFVGCEDLLPEYRQPENYFISSYVRIETDEDTLQFSEPRDGSGATVASYNPFYIVFKVTNVYEETFQYDISPKGTVELWVEPNQGASSISQFSISEIIPSSSYNANTGTLTLNPKQWIFFKVKLNPKLSNGLYIHKYAVEKSRVIYSYNISRIYFPLQLHGRFNIQLAPDLPAVVSDSVFTVNLKGRFPFSP